MSELESYTEVTTESWGSRLRDSLKGIVFGILLFLGGTALLWWNEGRTVSVGDAISEAERVAVDLPSVASVDPSFDAKLVHAFGRAETKAGVKDPLFPGVAAKGLALRRSAEFYQTVEHDESDGVKKDAKRPVQAASTPASGCPVPRLGASPTAPATTWFS